MSYGRSDATPLKNIKGKLKETNRDIIEVINIEGRDYPVQILVLLPGSLLYTASRNGLDFSHTGWFGIKREDVVQYGNKIEKFQINQEIKILDLSLPANQVFVDAILNETGKSIFNKNWVGNRETYRSGDFLVSKQLKQKLPNYEIYGFGTGRGRPYEDSPVGHHAEIALFPNAYNSLQLMYVENREEVVDDARGRFSRELKRKRSLEAAARGKRRNKIKRGGLDLDGPPAQPRNFGSFMQRFNAVVFPTSPRGHSLNSRRALSGLQDRSQNTGNIPVKNMSTKKKKSKFKDAENLGEFF